ncbi:large ribosomal subunit protein bL35m [Eurosta solidaginis]|uniref:large ribosomal subunit protein bL35m n=1 Tax=Eurosta solidaginis TaxID=178769 RepID=UPI00353122E4
MLRALISSAIHTVAHVNSATRYLVEPAQRALSNRAFQPTTTYHTTFLQNVLKTNVQPMKISIIPAFTSFQQQPVRSLTKFSLNKGKRKSVKAVLKRFKRLDWGIWIRTHSGRHKKIFKKSPALRRRLRQHIFTNSTQSYLLDKMVTSFWRRPKYYIDDPYAPFHKRDEFFATKSKTFKV